MGTQMSKTQATGVVSALMVGAAMFKYYSSQDNQQDNNQDQQDVVESVSSEKITPNKVRVNVHTRNKLGQKNTYEMDMLYKFKLPRREQKKSGDSETNQDIQDTNKELEQDKKTLKNEEKAQSSTATANFGAPEEEEKEFEQDKQTLKNEEKAQSSTPTANFGAPEAEDNVFQNALVDNYSFDNDKECPEVIQPIVVGGEVNHALDMLEER